MAGLGQNTASETDGGQFDDGDYSMEVTYCSFDFRDNEDMKWENSEREVRHQSGPTSGGPSRGLWQSLQLVFNTVNSDPLV